MLPETDKRFFRENASALKQLIPFVVLGLVVPIILFVLNVFDKSWFIYGPVTWLFAIGIKSTPFFIGFFFEKLNIQLKNLYINSIWQGLLSAIAELGLTIGFFAHNADELSLHNLLSFGFGIGFAEVLLILYLIIEDIEKVTTELQSKPAKSFVLWYQLLERILAIGVHVFSRAIIGIAMLTGNNYALIAVVFLIFAFVDGWGGYIARQWDLEKPVVQKKVYLFLLLVVAILAGIFFFLMINNNYI